MTFTYLLGAMSTENLLSEFTRDKNTQYLGPSFFYKKCNKAANTDSKIAIIIF
jgi:hypothetical protein